MRNINSEIKVKKDYQSINEKNFMISMENKEFASLCYKLNLSKEILCKYTSKLENTVLELNNCKNCKGLEFCKNEVKGYVNFPSIDGDNVFFNFTPCKYKKECDKYKSNVTFYETSSLLRNAKMKDIYLDDNARVELIKYIKDFMNDYPNKKGVYLSGSFGTGKSYILNALLNELSRRGVKCTSIYYPLLLKRLKDSFNSKNESYEKVYNELIYTDVLLIDDIGAENNTLWSRDEVLGGILQSRMDNKKITFFTSNYTLEELEVHLSETSTGSDKIKARRIIERIKELTVPIKLVGENKRGK